MKLYIVIINKLGVCNAFEGHISFMTCVCDVIGPWVSLIPRENFTAKFAWAMLPAENNMSMYVGIHIHTRVLRCSLVILNQICFSTFILGIGKAITIVIMVMHAIQVYNLIFILFHISTIWHGYSCYGYTLPMMDFRGNPLHNNLLTFIIDLIDHVYSTEKTQI